MNKLAIVCGAPSSEMAAPFDDPDYDIWALGNRANRYPRFDLLFEIHDDLTEHGDVDRYVDWLVALEVPLVCGENFPRSGSNITTFPFDQARDLLGQTYLTSSSAYMLAYGLIQGYTDISIYGVDLAVDDHEYFWQRPCMEAWVGFAKGRGVNVTIHPASPLFRSDYVEGSGCGGRPDFSLPPFTQQDFDQACDEHVSKIAELKAQRREIELLIATHDGCRQAYERMSRAARAVEAGMTIEKLSDTVVMR